MYINDRKHLTSKFYGVQLQIEVFLIHIENVSCGILLKSAKNARPDLKNAQKFEDKIQNISGLSSVFTTCLHQRTKLREDSCCVEATLKKGNFKKH